MDIVHTIVEEFYIVRKEIVETRFCDILHYIIRK